MTKTPTLLIFGYGNPGRGDDGLGPLLLEELEQRLVPATRDAAGGVEFLTDFQLQVEHALDLVDRRLVLFADADVACPPPYRLSYLEAASEPSYSTHAISPAAVLHWYREIQGGPPPPTFLLGIRGDAFELGAELSREARGHLAAAVELVLELCENPTPEQWRRRCNA